MAHSGALVEQESASAASLRLGAARVFSEESISPSYFGLQVEKEHEENSGFDENATDMHFIVDEGY